MCLVMEEMERVLGNEMFWLYAIWIEICIVYCERGVGSEKIRL